MLKSARQQATGYFNGIKLLIQESKDAKMLEIELSQGSVKSLSRSQFLFLKRNKQDLKNLVPFFFISIIIPELIPVLLLRGSTLIPSTCISPEQLEKKRVKHEEERRRICGDILSIYRKDCESDFDYSRFNTASSSWRELGLISRYYGYSKWALPLRLRSALATHMKDLDTDHRVYLESSLQTLTVEELKNALDHRGLLVRLDLSKAEMIEILRDFGKIYTSLANVDDCSKSLSMVVYGAILRESRIGKTLSPLN